MASSVAADDANFAHAISRVGMAASSDDAEPTHVISVPFTFSCAASGAPVDLLTSFSERSLATALSTALRSTSSGLSVECIRADAGRLVAGVRVTGVGAMASLRSHALDGGIGAALTRAIGCEERIDAALLVPGSSVQLVGLKARPRLNGELGCLQQFDGKSERWVVQLSSERLKLRAQNLAPPPLRAVADASAFALQLERTIFSQRGELTAHQRERLELCADDDVHLQAPAGAGKTFVALHRMLRAISAHGEAETPAEEDAVDELAHEAAGVAMMEVDDAEGGARRPRPRARLLYVARNEALALFAARWLVMRSRGATRRRVLEQLDVLCEPFEAGARGLSLSGGRITTTAGAHSSGAAGGAAGARGYALVVVDEAHSVYADAARRAIVESHVGGGTRRMLLSDVSQAAAASVSVANYPAGMRHVVLHEVVRCSKRIVAAAMAFQLGGEEKLLTRCQHESVGPPIKSFIFDVDAEAAEAADANAGDDAPSMEVADGDGDGAFDARFDAYARYTVEAIAHTRRGFDGLRMDQRLAILVPSEPFRRKLLPRLRRAISERWPAWRVRMVSAVEASGMLPSGHGDEGDEGDEVTAEAATSAADAMAEAGAEAEDVLLLDELAECDGLERLFVIAVGLDSPADAPDEPAAVTDGEADEMSVTEGAGDAADGAAAPAAGASGGDVRTRSMLYRALSRAMLQVVVVNESVAGGWLEFLGHVRLCDDNFDSDAELERTDSCAADGLVRRELAAAIAEGAASRALELDDAAASALAAEAGGVVERGGGTEECVAAALDKWDALRRLAECALRAPPATGSSGVMLPDSDGDFNDGDYFDEMWPGPGAETARLVGEVALALLTGQATQTEAAASSALGQWRSKLRDAALRRSWQHVAYEFAPDLRGYELCERAIAAVLRRARPAARSADEARAAAARALVEWMEVHASVESSLSVALSPDATDPVPPPSAERRAAISLELSLAAWDGGPLDTHTEQQVAKWREPEVERVAAAALEVVVGGPLDDGPMALLVSTMVRRLRAPPPSGGTLRDGLDDLASELVAKWAADSADAAAAVVVAALEEKHPEVDWLDLQHDGSGTKAALVLGVVRSVWGADESRTLASPPRKQVVSEAAEEEVRAWAARRHMQDEETAEVGSAVDAAIKQRRLLLGERATAALVTRVAGEVSRGADLEEAVAAALDEIQTNMLRRQVQQTVWDTSSNQTRVSAAADGAVRFFPFRARAADAFDYELLSAVFAMLPLSALRTLSLVCKRWRSVARDPSWMPELLAFAWGETELTGLAAACPKPSLLPFSVHRQVRSLTCSDAATFALTVEGQVWWWGHHWLGDESAAPVAAPQEIDELRDVSHVHTTPSGYFHQRGDMQGYSCAAITRAGELYTWGRNDARQLLHPARRVDRPARVALPGGTAGGGGGRRVVLAGVGLWYLAICVTETEPEPEVSEAVAASSHPIDRFFSFYNSRDNGEGGGTRRVSSFHTAGLWCPGQEPMPLDLREWTELRGQALRQVAAGAFHCVALTTRGEVWTLGHQLGADISNGNLLGHGAPGHGEASFTSVLTPRLVVGLPPIAEVAASTYSSVAIAVDGRSFTWGDSDGDALGHGVQSCHTPQLVTSLRGLHALHASLSYTNGAIATSEGRIFVWGGNAWQGGIAAGRQATTPTEEKWAGVPRTYKCSAVELSHRHGFLIFRKQGPAGL